MYNCVVLPLNGPRIPIKDLGAFDDIDKDFRLHPAGNCKDIGHVSVYPRIYERVSCRSITINGKTILSCEPVKR